MIERDRASLCQRREPKLVQYGPVSALSSGSGAAEFTKQPQVSAPFATGSFFLRLHWPLKVEMWIQMSDASHAAASEVQPAPREPE